MKDKILWDFEIQTDQIILARRLDIVLINKVGKSLVNFAILAGHKESEKIHRFCQRTKKTMEHEGDSDINCR